MDALSALLEFLVVMVRITNYPAKATASFDNWGNTKHNITFRLE